MVKRPSLDFKPIKFFIYTSLQRKVVEQIHKSKVKEVVHNQCYERHKDHNIVAIELPVVLELFIVHHNAIQRIEECGQHSQRNNYREQYCSYKYTISHITTPLLKQKALQKQCLFCKCLISQLI